MLSSAKRVEHAVAERRRRGESGGVRAHILATGEGWRVVDCICSADASDPAAEEQHEFALIALVSAGAFDYRGAHGGAHLQNGAVLLGNAGAPFRCSHAHGAGDRCIAFQFAPHRLEALWAVHAPRGVPAPFTRSALPANKSGTSLIAEAEALAEGSGRVSAADLALRVATHVLSRLGERAKVPSFRQVRVATALARTIEAEPDADWPLDRLARMAEMDVFALLRCFKKVNGLTPHAFVRQARLRGAARLLRNSDLSIVRVAGEVGFGDLSTFNSAFKLAFGTTPSAYRASSARAG
jgi:AraC family transcriptional regulator